jgi:DNA-binding HxlR family transcriptional regulator
MQLRELELHDIVYKESIGTFPLHTEYILTSRGRSILPIIASLDNWGIENMDLFNTTQSVNKLPA